MGLSGTDSAKKPRKVRITLVGSTAGFSAATMAREEVVASPEVLPREGPSRRGEVRAAATVAAASSPRVREADSGASARGEAPPLQVRDE